MVVVVVVVGAGLPPPLTVNAELDSSKARPLSTQAIRFFPANDAGTVQDTVPFATGISAATAVLVPLKVS